MLPASIEGTDGMLPPRSCCVSSGCRLFVGLHQPSDAQHFDAAFVSVNRLRKRKSDFKVGDWIMDSGAFTEIATHGRYRESVDGYVERKCGNMLAAVSQDYMCEAWILEKTGLTIADHQRLTIERYDAIQSKTSVYIMPVLQGFDPGDYVAHVRAYGERLTYGMWVGVGSVCKRNGDPGAIYDVLSAIKRERPDLRLHGFGLKTTALADGGVFDLLHTADSMAWSFAARKQGRNANDYREAQNFERRILGQERQGRLFFPHNSHQ
jgi:transcriptional regulator of met regulon